MAAMPVVLVTGGYDHKIRFWDATSGLCTKAIGFGDSQVNCVQVSSDKSLLVAGGNPMIQLFDVNTVDERPLITYDGHTNNVTTVGFQRDQKWLYSSSEDGTVRVWDTRSNNFSRKYDCGSPVNTVCLHPNQAELISGDQNGTMKVWDLTADKCREEYVPLPEIPIRSISIVSVTFILHVNFFTLFLVNCTFLCIASGIRCILYSCWVPQRKSFYIYPRH
jgi:target of rapamycin complex subunit LST8